MDGRVRAVSLVLYVVGLAVLAAATTAAYLAMRDVMAIGGSCASGGPYEVATPCPDGTAPLMIGGILGWFLGAGLTAIAGSRLPGSYGALALVGWPALFLSLGWNFLDYGLDPADGGGADGSLVFCGVLFFLMGGVPLLIGVKGLARALWPGTTAPEADGSWGLTAQIRAATSLVGPRIVDLRRTPAPPADAPPADAVRADVPPADGAAAPAADIARELERLAELHREGALDDDEFERAKGILLGVEDRP